MVAGIVRIAGKAVGGLRINGKTVGGMRIGGKVVALGAAPAPVQVATLRVDAIVLSATATGEFGSVGSFTHAGQRYDVGAIFTDDNNGFHIRFGSEAQIRAFLAGGFTVDSGITGQSAFKVSSLERYPPPDQAITGALYPTFPGRYAANTRYTVTISA